MPRVSFTISDAAHNEIQQIAQNTGKPVSLVLREAISAYLETQGKTIDPKLAWGGDRRTKPEVDDSQG